MNTNIKLFNIYHTSYPNIYENDFTTAVLVGTNDVPEINLKIKDYYPELSKINRILNESEAEYYIGKNVNAEIKGQYQYSNRLNFSSEQIIEILNNYKFIVFPMYVFNIYDQYKCCHSIDDLDLCINLVLKNNPLYKNSLEKGLNSSILFAKHIYITRSEEYDKYMNLTYNTRIFKN